MLRTLAVNIHEGFLMWTFNVLYEVNIEGSKMNNTNFVATLLMHGPQVQEDASRIIKWKNIPQKRIITKHIGLGVW